MQKAKIMIVGSFPSAQSYEEGKPFIGSDGAVLSMLLGASNILRRDCHLTYVFKERPPEGELVNWCTTKKEANAEWKDRGNTGTYPYEALTRGKYLRMEHIKVMDDLKQEIKEVQPNVIVCLGAEALWGLTGTSKLTKIRGTISMLKVEGIEVKMIPTFSLEYINAKWESRVIVMADLAKAQKEQYAKDFKRTPRELWIRPTLEEIEIFTTKYLLNAPKIAWDIETSPKGGFITNIGFGTKTHAINIPLYCKEKKGWYWDSPKEEAEALRWIKTILELPSAKITQNGMYDMQWVWWQLGITPRGELHDTQLVHHSLYPELPKDLGFLASLYTNEVPFKTFNPHTGKGKKDE